MLKNFRDKFRLEIVVFTSGALVMIYEIIGSRLLAPFIGTSTYVWTSLIGVILGSLSLGYWFGGRLADRQPNLRVLARVLFLAGAFLSITLLLQIPVLSTISGLDLGLEIKSIAAALILFAPAGVLFGFVTPYAVRLKMLKVEDAGKTVGRLYALSTIGSILGTFLAGFFLLPFIGSLRTLYVVTGILFALSLLMATFKPTSTNLFFLILFPTALIFNEVYAYMMFRSFEFHDIDTEYNRLQILQAENKYNGRMMRVLLTDPLSTQSAMFLDSDELALNYSKYYHLLRHFKPDFEETLIIGGAAYSFPKDHLRVYPGKRIDVVEIDPRMTALARQYFRLEDNPNLKSFHEDGRVFLNRNQKKYDVILVDAFSSQYSVPFQLTTVEAVRKMDKSLKNNGVVILNLISALDGNGSLFLKAEYKTFREVFPHVYLFKTKDDKPENVSQNVILVATRADSISFESADQEISGFLKNRYEKPLDSNISILTDELAPVEYYNSFAQKVAEK